MKRCNLTSWALGIALAAGIVGLPYVYYRATYTYQKRFRVVTPDKLYRSGCMTAWGLEEAIKKHRIRTVINLMEEAPDPSLAAHFFSKRTIPESELCQKLGVRYYSMLVEYLPLNESLRKRPATIERYLEILDDPSSYPVLVHCKAGLHRTGVLVGVYRMEYEDWTTAQALAEIKKNGFGEFASTSSNEYIRQYILDYRPHQRRGLTGERQSRAPGNLMSRPGGSVPSGFAPMPKDQER